MTTVKRATLKLNMVMYTHERHRKSTRNFRDLAVVSIRKRVLGQACVRWRPRGGGEYILGGVAASGDERWADPDGI